MIPVYDIDAQAGSKLFADNPDEKPIGIIKLLGVKADAAIVVHGDSMHPEYQSGDLILIRKIISNVIEFGKSYLICTLDYRFIKYIFPSENDKELVLKSCNQRYPEFKLLKQDILHLYIIVGKFRKEIV